jgi:tetratricopeptide (TPR) repeat protein
MSTPLVDGNASPPARSARVLFIVLAAAVLLALLLFGKPAQTRAAVRVPHDDREVLTTLPFPASDARKQSIARLRRALAQNPRDLAAAVELSRADIVLARERSDPRYLGHAQAALAPWWSVADAPASVLVLRATIEQSLHDFDAALADLDRALALAPDDVQAWLTRATVLTVRARYDDARASCARVLALGAGFAALACGAGVDGVTGSARAAHDRLAAASRRASREERQWGLSLACELSVRAGDGAAAEAECREALELDPRDGYTRGVLSDLLLDAKRERDVVALLADQESNDALLLRLAIAEERAGVATARAHVEALGARFASSRARGDVVHRREEARFWLELGRDPSRALVLAKENFDVQKEPADVRVLLEAAISARGAEAAAPALQHVARTRLEDPAIARAVAALGGPRPDP